MVYQGNELIQNTAISEAIQKKSTQAPALRSGVRYSKAEIVSAIRSQAEDLLKSGRLHMTKTFTQHADMSVFQHCAHVAYISCLLCQKLHIRVSWDEMIRGALLHDYFLYDWHDRSASGGTRHAWYHPTQALLNAVQDYELTEKEMQIIKRHMWPVTIIPPTCREAWVVTTADKICTILDVFRLERVRL